MHFVPLWKLLVLNSIAELETNDDPEIAAKTSQHKIQLNALTGFSDGGSQLLPLP